MRSLKADFDLNAQWARAQAQFSGLNPAEPGQWPLLPKVTVFVATALVMLLLGWLGLLSGQSTELDGHRAREEQLKREFQDKTAQAVNLEELRKQRAQVQEYVTQLEKQLPGKAEMDALLSDINQAGVGRGLNFELFKPGSVVVKDYYAELPISLRVSGRYHDFGSFASDIANLSRIVTLHDLQISAATKGTSAPTAPGVSGELVMEATARTYRYLDPSEVEAGRISKKADKKKPGANGGDKS